MNIIEGKEKGITVLSLFDGMSCGQIALERLGIKVNKYYASEIDKNAIKVAQHNYPDTIQLGNVSNLKYENGILYSENGNFEVGKIDLFIGGSPCKQLSRSILNRMDKSNIGLKGKDSKLFYEYVRILNKINPTYFLLENVESMLQEDKDIITDIMKVEPIMINSSLVSAQDRKRYYWTNILNIKQPDDKGLVLSDVVETVENVKDKYWYNDVEFTYHGEHRRPVATLHIFKFESLQRVYGLSQKAPTLVTCNGGHKQKKVFQDGKCRKLTPLEYERLQTVPDNYTDCVADTHRYNCLGNGWTVDVIAHIFSYMNFK